MTGELAFFTGKRVFLTGHTGFKGAWMSRMLVNAGAVLTGYSLQPPTSPNLFSMAGLESRMTSVIGDIRDFDTLSAAFEAAEPEIVIHMAAQPIVRDSYTNPRYTYETNVMGTVNLLECVRNTSCVRSFLNVTTDKVYLNREWPWGYREDEMLDGFDPYSNSKSCSELVTHSYRNSFFDGVDAPAISTARAGNVIGGGDFANDRIIPDCVRAAQAGRDIAVRNPHSTRPYQHVLEPLYAYLMIAAKYRLINAVTKVKRSVRHRNVHIFNKIKFTVIVTKIFHLHTTPTPIYIKAKYPIYSISYETVYVNKSAKMRK
jgi:CDP-glucose 4,6-dehydratase